MTSATRTASTSWSWLDDETLAQRLEKGALPLDQALQIAIEIADALDKAHRQGIGRFISFTPAPNFTEPAGRPGGALVATLLLLSTGLAMVGVRRYRRKH